MKTIQEHNLSLAWLAALEYLCACGGKTANLIVGIERVDEEEIVIRQLFDKFIERKIERKKLYPISTVANTIFPWALYHPRLGSMARQHLYKMFRQGYSVERRYHANNRGTYFQRMIAWPAKGGEVNQLENVIKRLRSELARINPFSSIYELSIGEPEEYIEQEGIADIQVYLPGYDTRTMGFPCLSHICLTFHKGRIDMTALYRNQYFISKAYGNYLGLSRLLRFICQEVDCEAGELVCIASHADAELLGIGKRDILTLVEECREAIRSNHVVKAPI